MLTEDRKTEILNYIEDKNSADVTTLAELFHVSEVTIRRDLNELEDKGLINRVHGGAKRINTLTEEPEYIKRLKENNKIKLAIAKEALKFIRDDMVIFLDAGTTVFEIAKEIIKRDYKNLTIITNDINTAYLVYQANKTKLIMIGGNVINDIGNIQGGLANACLKILNPEIAFIGVSSVDRELRLLTPDEQKIELKQMMIKNANKSVLVLDETKFEKRSIYFLSDMDAFDVVITDYKFSEGQEKSLENKTRIIKVD